MENGPHVADFLKGQREEAQRDGGDGDGGSLPLTEIPFGQQIGRMVDCILNEPHRDRTRILGLTAFS